MHTIGSLRVCPAFTLLILIDTFILNTFLTPLVLL